MTKDKLINFNSEEKEIILSIFNHFKDLDPWIATIIENYIYSIKKEETIINFKFDEYKYSDYKDKNKINFNYLINDIPLIIEYSIKNDDIKQGFYIEYFFTEEKEKKIICKTNYKNNKLDGEYIKYYLNDQIEQTTFFKNNLEDGKSIFYYPNGDLKIEANYIQGEYDGIYKEYYSKKYNNQLHIYREYKNGKLENNYLVYFPNGELEIKTEYKDGNVVNKFESWYDNGKKCSETIYSYKYQISYKKWNQDGKLLIFKKNNSRVY
jgi:antitoxin component YwqK of YwqJK toxin-antitoxin module